MILKVRVNNFKVFPEEFEFDLCADEKVDGFEDNVYTNGNFKVLKSAVIYGANNSGKSCLLASIKCIRDVIMRKQTPIQYNFFSGSKIVGLGVSFLSNGRVFDYDFKYDATIIGNSCRGFVYECMKEIVSDMSGENSVHELFLRDVNNDEYRIANDVILQNTLKHLSTRDILIYLVNSDSETVADCAKILADFAESLDYLDTNVLDVEKTMDELDDMSPSKSKIINLIKMADLDIEDFGYSDPGTADAEFDESKSKAIPVDSDTRTHKKDVRYLYSVHHGEKFSSVQIDSVGTARIIALASYIIDAIENGRTLVIDEFDSGLHFKLTRALVVLFNNITNSKGGQLIFSTHDVSLMDCNKLFRQDQIWFICKEEGSEYLYSLADLELEDDEIFSDFGLLKKYNAGLLSVIPQPDLPLFYDDSKDDN